MTDNITLTGLVATEPKHLITGEGLPITSFRLASSLRHFDRKTNTWVEVGTNWYTVSAFRRLAMSAASSIKKGDRVIVTGRLRLRDWKAGERAGMSIEVDADALGHDLNWGTAAYMRTMSSSDSAPTPEDPAESTDNPTESADAGQGFPSLGAASASADEDESPALDGAAKELEGAEPF